MSLTTNHQKNIDTRLKEIRVLGLEQQPDNFLNNIPDIIKIKESNKMGITLDWIVKILISVLSPIVKIVTPQIKEKLSDFIKNLYSDALGTPNVWDDFLIKILADILSIDLSEVKEKILDV